MYAESNIDDVRDLVKSILQHPFDGRKWQLHGLGMAKTYFGATGRIHVWDWDSLRTEGVKSVHTHPWNFTSVVINGFLVNQRFVATSNTHDPDAVRWKTKTIECGPGGCTDAETRDVWLVARPAERYQIGDAYSQLRSEIHDSRPAKGCVTLVRRSKLAGANHADIFWLPTDRYVNAEPIPVDSVDAMQKVRRACQVALENWE